MHATFRGEALTRLFVRLLPLAALILPASISWGAPRPSATPGGVVTLRGSMLPNLSHLARLGAVAPGTPMGIGVALRVRHPAQLEALIASVSDPRSPQYRHYLSVAQFRSRFAPELSQVARIRRWLRSSGLRVSYQAPDGLLLEARGSARSVERTFRTALNRYRANRTDFFANASPVKLPAFLSSSVAAVVGLDNRYRVAHTGVPTRGSRARPRDPSSNYGYTPADFQRLYNLKPLIDSGVSGSGVSIGIISYQIISGDITNFDQEYSLPAAPLQQVSVKDPKNTTNYSPDWEAVAEAELDTEIAHAMAPGARIVLYNDSNEFLDSIYYSLANMVSENRVQVITSSLGGPDRDWAAYPKTDLVTATHDVLLEAAAQGQTVFSASGDSGAYGASTDGKRFQTTLMADYPCSDPYVTCVGGTTLKDTSSGAYDSESVWSNDLGASGGGITSLFARPAWQTGPGTDNAYAAAAPGRMVPDVSADGDPDAGYAVYVVNPHFVGQNDEYGGTSASAPLWAGVSALLDEKLNTRIGFFNPTLYALGAQATTFATPPFHDITSGNNLFYPATAGYDLATGWGTPDATALAADLAQLGQMVKVPIVVISSVHLQQKSGGSFANVSTIGRGKTARFVVRYSVTDGTGAARGRLQITRGKTAIGSWSLSGPAGSSGTMKRSVKLARTGAYRALITVSQGGYTTPATLAFRVS